eukprot:UN28250
MTLNFGLFEEQVISIQADCSRISKFLCLHNSNITRKPPILATDTATWGRSHTKCIFCIISSTSSSVSFFGGSSFFCQYLYYYPCFLLYQQSSYYPHSFSFPRSCLSFLLLHCFLFFDFSLLLIIFR